MPSGELLMLEHRGFRNWIDVSPRFVIVDRDEIFTLLSARCASTFGCIDALWLLVVAGFSSGVPLFVLSPVPALFLNCGAAATSTETAVYYPICRSYICYVQ
jgi:hypothetical protein